MTSSHPTPPSVESTHPNTPEHPGWAGAHLGALTDQLSPDLVDTALEATGTTQRRLRLLPARTMIYFILALILHPHASYTEVFTKLTQHTGLLLRATSPALTQARNRLGVKPLRWLFDLLRGPGQTLHPHAFFGSYRVCAIDGTILTLPDAPKILAKYHKQAGNHGGTGYPQARLVALVDCATRSIIDAVFGPTSIGETTYTPRLLPSMRPDMLILGDRNFASAKLLHEIINQKASFLVRVKNGRNLPVEQILPDGSYLSTLSGVPVRVLNARITLRTEAGAKTETYRLVTNLYDPAEGNAEQLIELYHQRWEIETTFRELKATLLKSRVLRSRSVTLVEQEIYALLIVHQLLRTVMAEATNALPGLAPDRASYTVALAAAQDLLLLGPPPAESAAVLQIPRLTGAQRRGGGKLLGQHPGWLKLAGAIGVRVLAALQPARRLRTSSRTVKRSNSNYQARAGNPHTPTRPATLSIEMLGAEHWLTSAAEL